MIVMCIYTQIKKIDCHKKPLIFYSSHIQIPWRDKSATIQVQEQL